MRKEIHLVIESDLQIHVVTVTHTKNGKFDIRENFSFEKSFIEIGAFDPIKRITLENYAD